MKFDVFLHFALMSEFEYFKEHSDLEIGDIAKLRGGFKSAEFQFVDKRSEQRSGLILISDKPGDVCKDLISRMLNKFEYKPEVFINLGISGNLSSDVKIGDLVVASELEIYDYDSAIKDGTDEDIKIEFSGRNIRIDEGLSTSLSTFSSSLIQAEVEKQFPDKPLNISEFATENTVFSKLDVANFCTDRPISHVPFVHRGKIGSGTQVIKSHSLKNQLLLQDRKFLAIDMESGHAGDSCHNESPATRYLSVRAITDPGDTTKKEYDDFGPNFFRCFGMSVIAVTISSFLAHELEFVYSGSDQTVSFDQVSCDKISQRHFTNDHPGQRISFQGLPPELLLRNYPNLNERTDKSDRSEKILEQCFSILTRNDRFSILVDGGSGSGKTALLWYFYEFYKRKMSQENHYAVYICKESLWENYRNTRSPGVKFDQFFRKHFLIVEQAEKTITFFIDSLDDEDFSNQLISSFSRFYGSRQNVNLVCARTVSNLKNRKSGSSKVEAMPWDLELEIHEIRISDTEKMNNFIDSFFKGNNDNCDDIDLYLKKLRALGTKYCSKYLLSLYHANINKPAFREAENYVEFITASLRDLANEHNQDSVQDQFKFIAEMGIEAIRKFAPHASCKKLTDKNLKRRNFYNSTCRRYPRITQNILIAHGIIDLVIRNPDDLIIKLKDYQIVTDIFENIVFDNDVNSAIKKIIDKQPEFRAALLAGAENILNQQKHRSSSFASYLIGRLADSNMKMKYIDMLSNYDEKISQQEDARRVDELKEETRLARMARRSRLISMSTLGSSESANEYINLILFEKIEDALNRGFHLEYYLDRPNSNLNIEYALSDEPSTDWTNTRIALSKKIFIAADSNRIEPVNMVEIATYFSFLKARHESGYLKEKEQKQGLEILEKIPKIQITNENLKSFLNAFRINVENFPKRFNSFQHIINMYNLKHELRAGWLNRKIGKLPEKVVTESVGAHVFGTMLIAWFLLPEKVVGEPGYSKEIVQGILLLHDSAESFYGDYAPDTLVDEKPYYDYVGGLRSYSGLYNITQTHNILTSLGSNGINYKLANDIDKLDALIQGVIYKAYFPEEGDQNFETFYQNHIDRIETDWGSSIVDSIRDFIEAEPGYSDYTIGLKPFEDRKIKKET